MTVRLRNTWCRKLAWLASQDQVFIVIRGMEQSKSGSLSARSRRLWTRRHKGWRSWCADSPTDEVLARAGVTNLPVFYFIFSKLSFVITPQATRSPELPDGSVL